MTSLENLFEKLLNTLPDISTCIIQRNDEIWSEEENSKSRSGMLEDTGGTDDILQIQLQGNTEIELPVYSLKEVSEHCDREDAWTVIYDKVYNVTEYLMHHPGGEDVLLEYIGYDATIAFRGVGHSRTAFRILTKYCIGILPKHERLNLIEH
ncbi:cytochrome b5 [Eurytemora carolleeae]|uniref:cytochrome b5 n=1 Tax=Eurytemora carolleeae TaxID=1294199 RepID=UPI000C78598B|nr:cytochrome b5 [Eurytemora carolleeae]|eukprot:XP_023333233.1 cytochrome b5-like [Eurytemora affinis]